MIIGEALAPELAHAGSYKMYACNVPGHATSTPTIGPWTWQLDAANTTAFNNCAAGGTFGIGLNPGQRFMRQTTSAWLILRRPTDGPFSRIGIIRYRTWLVAQLSGSGAPAFIAEGGAFSPPGGATSDADPWVSPLFPQTNEAIAVQLYCSAGAPADCFFDSAKPLQARGIEVELYEENPPAVTIDGGSLLHDAMSGQKGTVSYSAADAESGVARIETLLGDVIVGRHELGADPAWCPHTGFNACRGMRSSDMNVDTSGVAAGPHVLSLRATDAAGNRKIVTGPKVSIPVQKNATEVKLSARFTGSVRRTSTSRFGQRVIVRGRLTDGQDRGIANAELFARERSTMPGARTGRLHHIRTRNDGTFVYTSARRAPSRTIGFRYEGRLRGREVFAVRTLKLKVRASARLNVSLRGIAVRYRGRITTRPVPQSGKVVHIQGRVRGGVWQTFANRRSTHRGDFRGTYRLRVHRPGVRLEFRVRVPREQRYPFVAGVGRVVAKTVK